MLECIAAKLIKVLGLLTGRVESHVRLCQIYVNVLNTLVYYQRIYEGITFLQKSAF